jgi:methyl-accepting chemotaxis protein
MIKNIKIRTRLFIGFGMVFVFLIVTGFFSLQKMRVLFKLNSDIYNHPLAVSKVIHETHDYIIKIQRSMNDLIMAQNSEQIDTAAAEVDLNETEVYKQLDIITEKFLGDKKQVEEFRKEFALWKSIREEEISLIRQGKRDEASAITKGKSARFVADMEKNMSKLVDLATSKALQLLNNAKEIEKGSYALLALIATLAILFSLFITLLITNSITRPMTRAVTVAKSLAANDISIEVEDTKTTDETGTLLRAMKEMLDNLRKQIREITEGVNVLADSTSEISTTTTQFASSFNEIASSISQTVTSIRELKQTSELSIEKARFVSDGSLNVIQVSRDGEKAVGETITAMNSIQEQMISIAESIVGLSEKTQSIGEIISVVEDIAEQSRLLAVNASIEAVKAGEHGKGFSVVAGEIKDLAQQSRQATKQARGILTDIQKATGNSVMVTEKGSKTVDSGVRQAHQTGEAIQTLGQSIIESSRAATQIEATARQQLAGIGQVFSAMETINIAIKQNAGGAEQLQKAAQNLDELSGKLKSIIKDYKL